MGISIPGSNVEEVTMATCNATQVGEVYACKRCGWEFKVTKACGCDCKDDVTCCGAPVEKVETAEE